MSYLHWQVSALPLAPPGKAHGLITSNLLCCMDLKFQDPVQYCSLQYWTLFSLPDTFTTEHHFCFSLAASFFLELLVIALNSSPVAYQTPSDLRGVSSGVISFCLFILFMGFLQQEYWSDLPFPSPVDHNLSELFTMTCPPWVALHSMTHSFIELSKPLHYT